MPSLDEWIGSLFAEEHLDATCEALAAVRDLDPEDDQGRELAEHAEHAYRRMVADWQTQPPPSSRGTS